MRGLLNRRRNDAALGLLLVVALGALLAASAEAAAVAPTVATGPVSAVTTTSAMVSGSVDPNGTATAWVVDYGTSTSYGSETTSQSAGSGTTSENISATLSGLTPATTYHYRFEATSAGGTADGSDGLFTTSPLPAAVTGSATNVSGSSATLNGTIEPNGQQASYYFQYGTSTAYGSQTVTSSAGDGESPISVSAAISGLQGGQTYHFRLVATDTEGSVAGADATFTPTAAPSAVTQPASSVSSSGAQLNGTVNPNGVVTSWHFQYGTTTAYGSSTETYSAGAGSQPVAVSAKLSGLVPAAAYHFRLVATSSAGTGTGVDLSFANASPPLAATGSAEGPTANSVTLTGSLDPHGLATKWYFQYGTTTSYGSQSTTVSVAASNASEAVTAAISKLAPSTTYHYRLVATSAAGTSNGSDVTFTTPQAITLSAASLISVYGHTLTLSGVVAGGSIATKVTVLAEALGQSAFTTVATVTTGSGGSWSYQARPGIETSFEASAEGGTSPPIVVGVRPAVTIRLITGDRLLIRALGASSLAGRKVKLQRLRPLGGWSTIATLRLNTNSGAVVEATSLPHGTSIVRVAMSDNEAGRGYLAGFSRTLSYHRD